jgi:hypothetical protein
MVYVKNFICTYNLYSRGSHLILRNGHYMYVSSETCYYQTMTYCDQCCCGSASIKCQSKSEFHFDADPDLDPKPTQLDPTLHMLVKSEFFQTFINSSNSHRKNYMTI